MVMVKTSSFFQLKWCNNIFIMAVCVFLSWCICFCSSCRKGGGGGHCDLYSLKETSNSLALTNCNIYSIYEFLKKQCLKWKLTKIISSGLLSLYNVRIHIHSSLYAFYSGFRWTSHVIYTCDKTPQHVKLPFTKSVFWKKERKKEIVELIYYHLKKGWWRDDVAESFPQFFSL